MTSNRKSYLINEYNFSRRVVDHRIPHDLNYSINKPFFTKAWMGSAKQRLIGTLVYNFGIYGSLAAIFFGTVLVVTDALLREKADKKSNVPRSLLFNPIQTYGQNFVSNYKNKELELGKWNHNFACFENQPNCGRDFNWVKKDSE